MEFIAFAVGLVVSTIIWALVARNNKKHLAEVFDKIDEIIEWVQTEVDDVKDKVDKAKKATKDIINGQ